MPEDIQKDSLKNKVAVVTGGASGIGRAIAIAYAEAGAKVVVGDINEDGLSSLKEELGDRCEVKKTDVTKEIDITALMDVAVNKFGKIDIGTNCAGASTPTPILEIDEKTWEQNLNLNLKGIFLSLKHEAKQMKKQNTKGVIINITSVTASLCAIGLGHYASAKAGADHLTRIAAEEFRELGIRVVGIAPGLIRTPLAEIVCDTPDLLNAYNANVPSGRAGEVEDVANAAVFLASDAADFINGSIVFLDGGHKANGGFPDLGGIAQYYKK